MLLLVILITHWYLSLFLQSFFHHRYAAHRMFTMTRRWERFFFIACFMVHGSSYLSANAYAVMHRLHHAHTDTVQDPHSPHNASNIFAMLLQGRNYYFSIFSNNALVHDKYKKDIPSWNAFDRMAHSWLTRSAWVIVYLLLYMAVVENPWYYIFLPLTIAMSTIQGAVVNWWAHRFGYENFTMDNTSKNILKVDVLFCGEAYHNNHHKYPGRPNNAHRWFEIDVTYFIMRILHTCRVIRLANGNNCKAGV